MKTLILIDHDGTLCQTNPNAYSSLIYAAKDAANLVAQDTIQTCSPDWDNIFSINRGTTERHLAKEIAHRLSIHHDKIETYIETFIRSRLSWYERKKEIGEYIADSYYADAIDLIEEISLKKNSNITLMLTTGNPESVLKARLGKQVLRFFVKKNGELKGTFGDQAETREELIRKAILDFEEVESVKVSKDEKGFYKNIFYIGDSVSDAICGLTSRVKTIWIPSRSLQDVIDQKNETITKFLIHYFKEQLLITNDLQSQQVRDFIKLK